MRKRDRASVLAWLARATPAQRQVFKHVATEMINCKDSAAGYSKAQIILAALIYQV